MTNEPEAKRASRFTLEEFPGYTCYMFSPASYKVDFRQQSFDAGNVNIKFGRRYMFYCLDKECCILPNTVNNVGKYGSGMVFKDDTLLIHPDSKIPRTLVSKGKVFSERGTDIPTKIVVPDNYPQCVIDKKKHETHILLFVNDDAKLVFAVESYTSESSIGGSLAQWKSAFYASSEVFENFSEFVDGFTMPYGTRLYTIVEGLTELDKAIIWKRIPYQYLVHESNIVTGEDEPTVDMLYSVYMMLQSPDDQIVETAFNMLARSKFLPVKYIIKWLLNRDSRARYYCNKSTAFKWMYSQCCNWTSALFLPDAMHKKVAKGLIQRITNMGIDFDESGTMKVNDSKWLQQDNIRLLASKI